MNSILQCIFHTDSMRYLTEMKKINEKNENEEKSEQKENFLEIFCDLMEEYWSSKKMKILPTKFFYFLKNFSHFFNEENQQNDCTEFLEFLFEKLNQEMEREEEQKMIEKIGKKKNKNMIEKFWFGKFYSTNICTLNDCNFNSPKKEDFFILHLPIFDHENVDNFVEQINENNNIYSYLDLFQHSEIINLYFYYLFYYYF